MSQKSAKPAREARGPSAESREDKAKRESTEHPLAPLAGIFKDDPLWDEFVEEIRRARAEEDEKEDVPG